MKLRRDDGYSIVMLMAGITFMLIAMAAAAPSWQHVMQKDREEELIFRGQSIADGIAAFQKKNGNALPTSLEVLVKGHFLRKAYKDPMTKDGKWKLLGPGTPAGTRPPGIPGSPSPSPGPSPTPGSTTSPGTMGQGLGGFMGVASLSKQKSLCVTTTGAKSYDAWQFIAGQRLACGKAPTTAGPGILNPSTRPGASPPVPATPRPPVNP